MAALKVTPSTGVSVETSDHRNDWQSLEATEKFVAERPWEQVFPDAEKRMWMNGETAAQMEFAQKIRAEGWDHSIDGPWKIDKKLIRNDRYVLITTVFMLAPKILLLALPTYVLILPCVLGANWWGRSMPVPTDRPKNSLPWSWLRILLMPFFAMSVVLALLGLVYDHACHFAFGWLFWVCRGCPSLTNSMEALRPFRGGPLLIRYIWRDVGLCLAGQSLRHGRCVDAGCCAHTRGAFLIAWHFSIMVLLIPTTKYWLNANFWVYDLGVRYVQQITTRMDDLGVPACVRTSQKIISQSVQEENMRARIDAWRFVPHYPYPWPETKRRFSIGMQQAGKMFTLLVHTTHARMEVDGCTEQLLLSNSAQVPIYRVMLWYNNVSPPRRWKRALLPRAPSCRPHASRPLAAQRHLIVSSQRAHTRVHALAPQPYHIFTGFVEASVSTGGSQGEKPDSGEHPMWLVSGHSPMTAGRFSLTGTGMIDRFFDRWLPVFVEEMRRVATGNDTYAKEMRTEVISADGRSNPLPPGEQAMDDPNLDPIEQGRHVIPDVDQVKQGVAEARVEVKDALKHKTEQSKEALAHGVDQLKTAAHHVSESAQQTVKEGAGKVGEASHAVIAPIKAAIEQKTLQPVVEVDAGPSEVVVDVANASANE